MAELLIQQVATGYFLDICTRHLQKLLPATIEGTNQEKRIFGQLPPLLP